MVVLLEESVVPKMRIPLMNALELTRNMTRRSGPHITSKPNRRFELCRLWCLSCATLLGRACEGGVE